MESTPPRSLALSLLISVGHENDNDFIITAKILYENVFSARTRLWWKTAKTSLHYRKWRIIPGCDCGPRLLVGNDFASGCELANGLWHFLYLFEKKQRKEQSWKGSSSFEKQRGGFWEDKSIQARILRPCQSWLWFTHTVCLQKEFGKFWNLSDVEAFWILQCQEGNQGACMLHKCPATELYPLSSIFDILQVGKRQATWPSTFS